VARSIAFLIFCFRSTAEITLCTSVRDRYTTDHSAAVWKPRLLTGNAVKDLTIRRQEHGGRRPADAGHGGCSPAA
jgi:hypothetical protein